MLVYVGMSRYYINGSRRRQKAILVGEKRLGLESRQKNTYVHKQNCLDVIGVRTPVFRVTGNAVYH